MRGVESMDADLGPRELAEQAGRIARAAAVTGAVDHVSDGARVVAVANGDPLLSRVTGTGCIATAMIGCFLAAEPADPLAAAAGGLTALGVAAEIAAQSAEGPGSFHVALYDALAALEPEVLHERARIEELVA